MSLLANTRNIMASASVTGMHSHAPKRAFTRNQSFADAYLADEWKPAVGCRYLVLKMIAGPKCPLGSAARQLNARA